MEVREPEGLEEYRRALECHDRAWRVGYRGVVPRDVIDAVRRPPDDDRVEAFRDEVAAEAGPFLVAEREDRVVGYVRARYAGVSAFVGRMGAELVALYVDPAHWRQGVGSALLGTCVEWLPPSIEGLDARVLADNDRGRAFLEAHDLVYEETATAEVAGEPFEHAIYRVGLADEEPTADADEDDANPDDADADADDGGDDGPDVATVSDVPAPGSFGASETGTDGDDAGTADGKGDDGGVGTDDGDEGAHRDVDGADRDGARE